MKDDRQIEGLLVSILEMDKAKLEVGIERLDGEKETHALRTAEAGRTSTGMSDELTDAKIAAAEARTDTKFAELSGHLDTKFAELAGRLSGLPSRWEMWGGLLAVFVAVLAVLAFGGDRLALGLGQADARQQQLQRDQAQDATARETSRKLDELLKRIPVKP